MRLRNLFFVLFALNANIVMVATTSNKKASDENVIVQMNYCINTLTNIVHNKSMDVLEHESDQLVNNLTMQQIIGLPEIRDFRVELMDAVGKFEITEEERTLMRRIQSIQRDNMKWAAISNALNPTMLLTGGPGSYGPQLAFQVLLTAARSAIEYKTMQGEQNIEELQAMWELRKEDMQTISELRKYAQGIVFDLYDKYHLNENDRLTESTANLFNEYVSIADAGRRVRILQDNYNIYKKIPEYYYHLGMAYLDKGDYAKAKVQFSTYLEMYKRTPILRYDERSGCIALAMLTYDKTLSTVEKEKLISIVVQNLPSNSAAVLQCAMVYFYDLKQVEKGLQLIRTGIDDPQASDRDVLFMAAANLLPYAKKYPTIYNAICDTFEKTPQVSFSSYVTYLIYTQKNAWKNTIKMLSFTNCNTRHWWNWSIWTAFGKDNAFNDEFHFVLSNKLMYSPNDVFVYLEEHSDDELTIYQMKSKDCHSITEKEINDVDCFKANKNLKYLYVESLDDGTYKLKSNINIEKIKDETWPRQSEFVLSKSDIDDIVDFCEDYQAPTDETELEFSKMDDNRIDLCKSSELSITFYGDSLRYKAYHSKKQEGYYVRIVFSNGLHLLYKYDTKKGLLSPYMYATDRKRVFINIIAKEEYKYKVEPKEEEPSLWSKMCSAVSGWFSSDSSEKDTDEENVKKEDDLSLKDEKTMSENTSWWNKTISSIKEIF